MKIYDALHGFIHFNALEGALIDNELFQRLRYIHQLGIAYMVYPGATHTRFEHSLGTMHLAAQIFDQIAQDEDRPYWRQILRLAALCHDLGHLPFSHVAEHWLLGPFGHEEWTLRMIESEELAPIWKEVEAAYPGFPIVEHVSKLALGEGKLKSLRAEVAFTPLERIYAQIITGDFFGSDRIDYLLRDAGATGLSYGLFDYKQLIEMLAILPDQTGELTLGVEENGIASCEALLLARHFMQRRVYQYTSARAYSFHMARFMQTLYRNSVHSCGVKHYISMTEYAILTEIEKACQDSEHEGHFDARCFFDRSRRFQALHLPAKIEEDTLLNFQKKSEIPKGKIHWDLAGKWATSYGLDIPVLKKNDEVIHAGALSEISIPPTKKNWLYLAPEYTYNGSRDPICEEKITDS